MPETRSSDRLVVLEASRILGAWTRYEDHVVAAVPDDIDLRFTGGTAELGDVNVVHAGGSLDRLITVGRGSSPAERLAKSKRFTDALERGGIGLVRTVYGEQLPPTDPDSQEAARLLDAATTTYVIVDAATKTPDPRRTVLIPFAELSERFIGYPVKRKVSGRILAVSPQDLEGAAAGVLKSSFLTRTPDLTFRVAGRADPDISALVRRAEERSPLTFSARLELLSDAAVIEEITGAELVVVPEADTLDALHLVLLSLSFARPVLVRSSPSMLALADEIGAEWVVTYAEHVSAAALDAAVATVRNAQAGSQPDLTRRGMQTIGERYVEVFRAAAHNARRARTVPGPLQPEPS